MARKSKKNGGNILVEFLVYTITIVFITLFLICGNEYYGKDIDRGTNFVSQNGLKGVVKTVWEGTGK